MSTATDLPDLFPSFQSARLPAASGEVFARIGGAGAPLMLLHGYPQTHVCWHRVAQELAREFAVVVMDLRGYGASSVPEPDPEHRTYSKRAMAEDLIAAMRALGHERFSIMGHDRGARVAYRLALDHPEQIDRLVLLDILPTSEVWAHMNAQTALKSYHWSFLAQPEPLPETLIAADPVYYVEHTLRSWTRERTLDCFAPEALTHYRAMLRAPERIRAVCEDYRAGATIDRQLDEADRAAGRKIIAPTLVLWGTDYVGRGNSDPLDIWRNWCANVRGEAIVSGHFLAEENPEATLNAVLPFLKQASETR
jgi:Predicted hydrolases or acyltransferases (alpha/beta hydrolase superfamily)